MVSCILSFPYPVLSWRNLPHEAKKLHEVERLVVAFGDLSPAILFAFGASVEKVSWRALPSPGCSLWHGTSGFPELRDCLL